MKEKAQQLVEKFYFALPNNGSFTGINNVNDRYEEAKRCALIAVDEIMKNNKDNIIHWMPCHSEECGCRDYWTNVKQEIKKL